MSRRSSRTDTHNPSAPPPMDQPPSYQQAVGGAPYPQQYETPPPGPSPTHHYDPTIFPPGRAAPTPAFPVFGPDGGPPPGISEQVWMWFLAVDEDMSGQISADELRCALVNDNWSHFNVETCQKMITLFDTDNNGEIDLREFQDLWNFIDQWKKTFQKYDIDRSGTIEYDELKLAWQEMGYQVTDNFVRHAIERYDSTGRGGITLDNFIQACLMVAASRRRTDSV